MWNNFGQQLYDNIILNDRYLMYLEGLGNTLLMTIGAALIGIVLGALVAICKEYAKSSRVCRIIEPVCDVYITLIRGTPMMVQLLIFAFIIFADVSMQQMIYVAILAFGINSGAYVAEIMRAGIQAVNIGQTEAGRSLGLTKNMTMRHIVLPQAIRNILPALCNEAIVLLKETAIVAIIAVHDLTYKSTLIRSRTFSPVPLLVIMVVYLIVVMVLSMLMRKLERRLKRSDKRTDGK